MPFSSVLAQMVLFTMSQAWQLGRAVQRAVNTHSSVISAIVEQQGGLVLITGKVCVCTRAGCSEISRRVGTQAMVPTPVLEFLNT